MANEEWTPENDKPTAEKLAEKLLERMAEEDRQRLEAQAAVLHGEQGALNLSASLCHVLKDQGAQEYAANQTREEARHVTAFARYIRARWGEPTPCGPVLLSVTVGVAVWVAVGVRVRVAVGVGVRVELGVAVRVAVKVGTGSGAGVRVAVMVPVSQLISNGNALTRTTSPALSTGAMARPALRT